MPDMDIESVESETLRELYWSANDGIGKLRHAQDLASGAFPPDADERGWLSAAVEDAQEAKGAFAGELERRGEPLGSPE